MSNNRWINLSVAYLALVGAFLPYVGWSPSLSSISEDLGLSYSQAGGISSITGLVAGAMILIGGVIASRWGCKNVILAGLAAGLLGQAVFAAAGGFGLVVVARVLAGVSVGFLWVATYTMAVNWFRNTRKTGRAVGIMLSADGMGAVLGLFAFSAVLAAFGWRMGLAVQAVCLGAVLVVVLTVSRNAPEHDADVAIEDRSDARPGTGELVRSMFTCLKNRNVFTALLYWIGGVGLFSVIASWMPAILVEDAGMSESLAGFISALFSIAGSAAALSAPYIAEKLGNKKIVVVVSGIVTAVSLAALTIFLAAENYVAVALLAPIIGLGVYAGESLTLTTAVESVHARHSGLVNGIIVGMPWLISGFAYPYILGAVKDATGGFVQGFLALTVATIVLCALSPFLIREPAAVPGVAPEAESPIRA
ncbi:MULTISPECIES: nitrate/nitrite transporter [Nocardiaceae]|uniref:Nitrate/nitrite transporter NarK n=1 Tax=Rhodococcoides corynebacterioides TaxID=53972 RepID=A0ABS2KZK5_9NOCA|nr:MULTISPECIES: MFS transporter [Rhodococcus]MBM7417370.1 nitrate/nitrite transporter NarK [Rhodococcus corynebacterioides]MBP1115624.1 nitrate/nitrite transporter NarK [Rhodococcus sp. PvP016]